MVLLAARAVPATAGAQGFDCDTPLDAGTASQLVQAGFSFAVRYVSRSIGQQDGDLSRAEAQTILAAGLALMVVQHASEPGWAPTAALGATYGEAAGLNSALVVGCPAGMTLWCDLEGPAAATTAADTIAYVTSWAAAVAAYGYGPGGYVGYGLQLTSQQLYGLPVKWFWRSASQVPDVALRGYCMAQGIEETVAGVDLDRNVIMTDAFGGLPSWCRF